MGTSTQKLNDEIDQEEVVTAQHEVSTHTDDVIIENEKDVVLARADVVVSPTRIKVEPFSQNEIAHHTPIADSEVQIMSNNDFEAIINVSSESDGESDLEKMLQHNEDDDDADKDQFQLRLNRESQNPPSDVTSTALVETLQPLQEQEMSQSTANVLANSYVLRLNEFEVADRKARFEEISRKRKRPTKNRVNKKKSPVRLNYIDTSSEEQLGVAGMKDANSLMINDDSFSLPPTTSSNLTQTHPFTFISTENNQSTSDKGASCFILELQRVTFKRAHQVFEIFFNLPQFSCYDCILKNHDDIKVCLDLNDAEWQTLKDNLHAIGDYEYNHAQKRSAVQGGASSHYELSIRRQLDLYFSTLSKFKAFQLFSDGYSFSCSSLSSIPTQLPTSSAIDPYILSVISNSNEKL